MTRMVVVLDAVDIGAVSDFWATLLDGFVVDDDPRFHCVIDASGQWRLGVQHAPDHQPPDWPNGAPQQLHIDLHVTDPGAAEQQALAAGARTLARDHELTDPEGHMVLADPAGHPFCIGWGHPTHDQLTRFLKEREQA